MKLLTPICVLFSIALTGAQEVTQVISLRPGWNAVYLEVQPANTAPAVVFGNLPVASVWTHAQRATSADFIQDASEQDFKEAGWLGWFHPSRPEAFLGNLGAVFGNRAYLIKCTNVTEFQWTVTGRPSLRRIPWVPDAYNLRGFAVNGDGLASFLNYFRHSRAHFNSASGQLENIYRLNGSGQWALVSPGDSMRGGEAYWVYTRGASEYGGPTAAKVTVGDGLDFGADLTELTVTFANATTSASGIAVLNNATGPVSLARFTYDPAQGGRWEPFSGVTLSVAAGEEKRLRLAVRRQEIVGTNYSSVLEVFDDWGGHRFIPVTAQKLLPPSGNPLAGLWQGTARLTGVSEVNSTNSSNVTATSSEFNLRLLIHVNGAGEARLLREVVQMWRDGTFTNEPSGARRVERPGRYVLLTDDALIPQFKGSAVRDGESVGRRLSSIGYDFPTTHTNNFLNLAGAFGIGQTLTGALSVPYDHPTNPFKHKFHPDHDNLNVRFDGPAVEAYAFTRQIELKFNPTPAADQVVADFGYNEMGGAYREVITGIHKRPTHVSGTFQLNRVSQISELNPSPIP